MLLISGALFPPSPRFHHIYFFISLYLSGCFCNKVVYFRRTMAQRYIPGLTPRPSDVPETPISQKDVPQELIDDYLNKDKHVSI